VLLLVLADLPITLESPAILDFDIIVGDDFTKPLGFEETASGFSSTLGFLVMLFDDILKAICNVRCVRYDLFAF